MLAWTRTWLTSPMNSSTSFSSFLWIKIERLDEILNFNDNLTSIGTSDSHVPHDVISTFDVESLDVSDAVIEELKGENSFIKEKLDEEGKSSNIL